MKSTRERILQQLLANPQSSISDLAAAVGINAISVRHHLTSLQAEGLVAAQEERHGVGRPRLVYFLTEEGREKFPTRYLELTNLLINHLKVKFSHETLEDIFSQIADQITQDEVHDLNGLSVEQKLDLLKQFMDREGYGGVQWEKRGDMYLIHQTSCPYFHVTQQHPEVCTLTRSIMSRFLSLDTQKIDYVGNENGQCSFFLSNEALKDAA
ncbi:MAG: winged helix-turn-helix transcriptional regulator [Anaerolineaceae bacterium]